MSIHELPPSPRTLLGSQHLQSLGTRNKPVPDDPICWWGIEGGGEKSVKRERSQQDLIRLGFSCEWTKPIQNYETSGDPSLFIHSQSFWFCSFGNRVGEQHSTLVVCTLMRDGGISHGRLDREGEKKSTESSWLFILLLLPDKAYSFLPIPAAEAKADTA